mgnify:CR=1 FL=1
MFGSQNKHSVVAFLDYDPAADDDIPVWRAPVAAEITGASFTTTNDLGGSTANYFDLALYNGGTAGTALTAIAGTVGGTIGWTGLVPKTFTISNGTVAAGEVVKVRYNEEGTGTFTSGFLQIDYVIGQA